MIERNLKTRAAERGVGGPRRRWVRVVETIGCAAAVVAILSGCGSISERLTERLSEAPVVGLPANAPARPAEPRAFPAVHDGPQGRSGQLLSADEQRNVQQNLIAERTRQQKAAAADAKATSDTTEAEPTASRSGTSRSRSAGARSSN